MLVSFSGVIIICTGSSRQNSSLVQDPSGVMFIVSLIMNFTSSCLLGLINVLIRAMKKIHWAIMSGFQSFTGLIFSFFIWVIYKWFFDEGPILYDLKWMDGIFLFWTGLFGAVGQMLWIKSL